MPVKPTDHEDEYFARIEQEMKKKIAERTHTEASKEEKEKLRRMHFMKCPKCGMDLIEIDFKGVKIDECSVCRGMWLDAGEFDAMEKIEKPALQRLFGVFKK
ncbi:MAG: zf-TFIIB domain-containing protein [Deltaproteobacteria bacterium]|nr:zf-TFIIB domain-containing protein [Deltaproteobacteria bacterium]